MKKTKDKSYFKLVSGKCLPDYGKRILQVSDNKVYDNMGGYAVFLCEIEEEENSSNE